MIMMNHNLRVFVQVAEKGGFTAAAEGLYLSQPAVSRAVKTLEEELKVKLFVRDKRNGLILTDAGEQILRLAYQMADVENRMYQTAFQANHLMGGRVRIASMPILTSVILAQVFHDFRRRYPAVTLELLEGTALEIGRMVQTHQVDFGFTAAPFGELEREILLTDQMLAISRAPFADTTPLDINRLAGYILCDAGLETALDALEQKNSPLARSFTVQQPDSVVHFVKAGNGIGIISELVLNNIPNQLHRHPISPEIIVEIGLVANNFADTTPVMAVLMSMIRESCLAYQKRQTKWPDG